MKKRIGIIGFGKICNGSHLKGYEKCTDIAEIVAVCDNNPEKLKAAKEKLNLSDEQLFLDYHDLINSGLVDAVDICTPNNVHCEIATAAVEAGLDYSIEKPVGMDFAEANELFKKTEAAGVKSFVCFSYRYMGHFRYMRHVLKTMPFGRVRHIYMTYIHAGGLIEGRRLEWRFNNDIAGSGVLGDLGVHLIDAVRFLGEEFDGVFAQTGIEVKERMAEDSDEIKPVTTDDWCNMNAMTKNDGSVSMRISRVATNVDLVEFEVIGENGRMVYNVSVDDKGRTDGAQLKVSIGKGSGFETIEIPEEFNVVQSREFVKMLNGEEDECVSHLDQGIESQKILEAAIQSAKSGRYIKLSEIEG